MILHAQQNWFGPDLKSFQLSVSFWSALRWSSIVSKILLCSMSALLSFCYSCWCQLAVAGADWLVFCSCQDNAFHICNIHTTQVWTAKLSIGTLCSTKAHVFLCSTFFFYHHAFLKKEHMRLWDLKLLPAQRYRVNDAKHLVLCAVSHCELSLGWIWDPMTWSLFPIQTSKPSVITT